MVKVALTTSARESEKKNIPLSEIGLITYLNRATVSMHLER